MMTLIVFKRISERKNKNSMACDLKVFIKWNFPYLPLLEWISTKRYLINIQNTEDSKCLQWCLIAALERQNGVIRKKPFRVAPYEKSDIKLDMSGVQYSVSIKQVMW